MHADAERLIEFAPCLPDVGDLPHGDRLRAHIPKPLVHEDLLLHADAERLIEFAPGLPDVGDLPHGDREFPGLVQLLEQRNEATAEEIQRPVGVASTNQSLRLPKPNRGTFVAWQLVSMLTGLLEE